LLTELFVGGGFVDEVAQVCSFSHRCTPRSRR
jgi:hypothetical protein